MSIPITTDAATYTRALMNADCDITVHKYKWGDMIRRDVIKDETGEIIFSYVRDGINK